MAEFNVKSPFKMDSVDATVTHNVVHIGKVSTAFAGAGEDMLASFGIEYSEESQEKVAQAI